MKWKYFYPKFEYEQIFFDIDWMWAWWGHKFFAYDLVRNLKPQKIIELGTHRGTSIFSMAQAIKDGALETELYAVDTWKGDKHSGFYGEEVFEEVNQIKESFYPQVKLSLLRKTFDQASKDFPSRSVNILHIDGLHTYQAVKHDFKKWFPKVKENGLVLIHDIKVQRKDFGVYKLWNELKNKYKHLEFYHSAGLGVLFLGKPISHLDCWQQVWPKYYQQLAKYRELEKQATMLMADLKKIQGSKFYTCWQKYCLYRDKLKRLISV